MTQYKTTKYRLPDDLYERDVAIEKSFGIDDIKLYGYEEDEDSICIVGQIFAKRTLSKELCVVCTIYDFDDDILETTDSISHGRGFVTSMIKPVNFFDGFPFSFSFSSVPLKKVKKISITLASSY